MRVLLDIVLLFTLLPWWGALAVLGGIAVAILVGIWWVKRKFNQIVEEGVLNAGAALANADMAVYSLRAVPAPKGPSPHDDDPSDENYIEGLDGEEWDEPGVAFYELEAMITPADPNAEWSPDALTPVPADWVPDEPTDVCERMGCVHTAQVFHDGKWEFAEDRVVGPQRVKLLFGIDAEKIRAIQWRSVVTPVGGSIVLPAPHPSVATAAR